MNVLKFGVVAPVAAGVTADPRWMAAFARHLEACGFESIVAVEHTAVLATHLRTTASTPTTARGVSNWRPTARSLTRSTCCHSWPVIPIDSGWPLESWCCPTIIRWCWPNERRPLMRCRAGGFDCVSVSVGCGKKSEACGTEFRKSGTARRRTVGGAAGRSGTTGHRASAHYGEFFQFENVVCSPKPIAGKHLPVHVGGHSKAAARRAGRFGDGFQPLGVTGAQLDGLLALMRDEAAAAGRDPADIEVSLGHSVTKVDAERA